MTSPQTLVAEFHEKFGVPNLLGKGAGVREDRLLLRNNLIVEEYEELEEELIFAEPADIAKIAKEAADLVYVIYGMALEFGIDLDAVLAEVHKSNLTKTSKGKRADGKIQKGPNYEPAKVAEVLGLD